MNIQVTRAPVVSLGAYLEQHNLTLQLQQVGDRWWAQIDVGWFEGTTPAGAVKVAVNDANDGRVSQLIEVTQQDLDAIQQATA